MAVTVSDRISHAKVYMEPAIATIAARVAEKEAGSMSSWLRKLVLQELIAKNEIPQDLLVKLALG